jgi:hypothetical protein
MCSPDLSKIHLCMLRNLVLKVTYLHCYVVLEQSVELLEDPSPNLVYVALLAHELEILAPFWAISNVPTHIISTFAWEKFVLLCHI